MWMSLKICKAACTSHPSVGINTSPLLGVCTLKIRGKRKETNDVLIFYSYHSHRTISSPPTDTYRRKLCCCSVPFAPKASDFSFPRLHLSISDRQLDYLGDDEQIVFIPIIADDRAQGINPPVTIDYKLNLWNQDKMKSGAHQTQFNDIK